MSIEACYRINSPAVTHETIDGEAVIVNLVSGNYYSLQGSGAELWSLIEQRLPMSAIVNRMTEMFRVDHHEVENCVLRVVNEMEHEGLIVPDFDDARAAAPNVIPTDEAFEPPVLQKFTDMQELLLLDPIHEVDSAGWPNRKTQETM